MTSLMLLNVLDALPLHVVHDNIWLLLGPTDVGHTRGSFRQACRQSRSLADELTESARWT